MIAFTFIGMCVVAFVITMLLVFISKFIQKVIVGKYKLKSICKHEYVPYAKFYNGRNGIDYIFKCRKCFKQKEIKSYQKSKEEQVF